MIKIDNAKIFGGAFLLVSLFLSTNNTKAVTCGDPYNNMETKAWGDGYCWAKVYKIEAVSPPPSATCPTTATDADGNTYTSLLIPTLDSKNKSSSFCIIGPLKRSSDLKSETQKNNNITYYSFRAATNGEINTNTLNNGKVKGICPDGWYLPLAKDIEGALMSASQDSNPEQGSGSRDCWALNDFVGTLSCTNGLSDYNSLSMPNGYYKSGSWWGLGDKVEGIEKTMWTTSIRSSSIVYYFYNQKGVSSDGLTYRELTDGSPLNWNSTGDYMFNPVYCIKDLSSSNGTEKKITWYRDTDDDGYGNSEQSLVQSTQPSGYVTNKTDCNDYNANINPAQSEACDNGTDDNCNGEIDENCDAIKTWYRDIDGDNYGNPGLSVQQPTKPAYYVDNKDDCNDSDKTMNPGQSEACGDKKDNDCNGQADEACPINTTWYRDTDADGYGNPKTSKQSTTKPVGYVENNLDCNDSNKNISPKAKEICEPNKIDENCDGQKNEGCVSCYIDRDKDTYGKSSGLATYYAKACPVGYVSNKTDCNDSNNAIKPGAKENCYNRVDDNCDGKADDGRGNCY